VTNNNCSRSDDWIYWFLLCTISLNYNTYSTIADLHTFQFTVVHALGFSVSTSRCLVVDFCSVFWDIKPSSSLKVNCCFEGTSVLHFQGRIG
jgi:hypothetical protein